METSEPRFPKILMSQFFLSLQMWSSPPGLELAQSFPPLPKVSEEASPLPDSITPSGPTPTTYPGYLVFESYCNSAGEGLGLGPEPRGHIPPEPQGPMSKPSRARVFAQN